MALLFLMALRSPFAPGYVIFSFAWALTLLTTEIERARDGALLLGVFAIATVFPPLPTAQLALYSLFSQASTIAVAVWLILRRPTVLAGPSAGESL